jgi:hypothetical protein
MNCHFLTTKSQKDWREGERKKITDFTLYLSIVSYFAKKKPDVETKGANDCLPYEKR